MTGYSATFKAKSAPHMHQTVISAWRRQGAGGAAAVHADAPHPSAPVRLSFAQLLKRRFDIDIAQCPQCGGTLTIIAAIEDPVVIAKSPTNIGKHALRGVRQ